MMEIMSLMHGFRLVMIILLFHNVALESPEKEESSFDIEIPVVPVESKSGEEKPSTKEKAKSEEESLPTEESKSKEENSYPSSSEEVTFPPEVGVQQSSEESDESSGYDDQTVVGTKPATFRWPSGIVQYHIKQRDYDCIIAARIRAAMQEIERSSCVLFKDVRNDHRSKNGYAPWLSIENPDKRRECSHTTLREIGTTKHTKAILTLGYDCMQYRDILHALLHVLGFADEVTHPQRDKYVRIVWPNIRPEFRPFFYVKKTEIPQTMIEYDSMSVMHFHDRAYTMNGKATIVPQIPGLLIAPSDNLSQLDVMKLRLIFGHACNKRNVANLLQTCQNALREGDQKANRIPASESIGQTSDLRNRTIFTDWKRSSIKMLKH